MRNNDKKKIYGAIGFVVTLALLTGLVFSALDWWTDKGPSTWGKKKEDVQADAGGMFLEDGETTSDGPVAISFATKTISPEEYGDYGIMPIAESAQSITATVTPANAEDKKLVWSIAWESGTSGKFGNGKTVTEYVSGSASQDTLTYTLSCKQAFGEVIVVTAAIDGNPSVKATKKVQYQQKPEQTWTVNIAYTNSTAAKNITWAIHNQTSLQQNLKFPQATTVTELKNYYSATGSNKGTYTVTYEPTLSTVYTVAATIGSVTVSFGTKGTGYYRAAGAAGLANVSDIKTSWVVASGTGKTLSGFDFVNALKLSEATDTQYLKLRQNLATGNYGSYHLIVTVSAEINGTHFEDNSFAQFLFDKTSLGTFASSLTLGAGDITF